MTFFQFHNAIRVHDAEIGLNLPVMEMSTEMLLDAISEIVFQEKYQQNIAILSDIYKNYPKDPLKDSIFWIEHHMKYRKYFEEEPKELVFGAEIEFLVQIYILYRIVKWFYKKLVTRFRFRKRTALVVMVVFIGVYDFLSNIKFIEKKEPVPTLKLDLDFD